MSTLRFEPPLQEIGFVLREVLGLPERLAALPAFAGVDIETIEAIAAEAGRFAAERVLPLNPTADALGCERQPDGSVRTPPGFREAYADFRALGWTALDAPASEGGMGLPRIVFAIAYELLASASHAFVMYVAGGHCAADCLRHSADAALREHWLPALADGSVLATMCLSEPQAGSDIGLARTAARPTGDGRYTIHGTKIFTSGGEHDLTEQILHLVLARLPDAPSGTRGLSLFAVPKRLEDGSPNSVFCDGLEHKMGLHGSATCTLRFDGAMGQLVGDPHGGLRAMFPMLNEARLMSGLQANGMAEIARQAAQRWATERHQGRLPGQSETVRLIDHPDVQRMLLTQRCWTEGGRMLALQVAWCLDEAQQHPDAAVRADCEALAGLLTPVVKAFLTENAQTSLALALQVHGGYGFIRETGIEQLVRDARVTTLYEGTTGIQAQDLLMRKLIGDGGRRFSVLHGRIESWCSAQAGVPALQQFVEPLRRLLADCGSAIERLAAQEAATPGAALPACHAMLRLVGHLALSWMWARAAAVGEARRPLARFHFEQLLPEVRSLLSTLSAKTDDWAAALR